MMLYTVNILILYIKRSHNDIFKIEMKYGETSDEMPTYIMQNYLAIECFSPLDNLRLSNRKLTISAYFC